MSTYTVFKAFSVYEAAMLAEWLLQHRFRVIMDRIGQLTVKLEVYPAIPPGRMVELQQWCATRSIKVEKV